MQFLFYIYKYTHIHINNFKCCSGPHNTISVHGPYVGYSCSKTSRRPTTHMAQIYGSEISQWIFRRSFFETFLRVGSCMTFNYYSHTLTIKYKLLVHSTYGQNNWLVTWATRGRVFRLLTPNMEHCQFFIVTTKYTVLRPPLKGKTHAVALVYLHGTQMNK